MTLHATFLTQLWQLLLLAAFSYEGATGLVPRAWIIDALGNWRGGKDGYDESKSYSEFEKEMLDQVEKAKVGQWCTSAPITST